MLYTPLITAIHKAVNPNLTGKKSGALLLDLMRECGDNIKMSNFNNVDAANYVKDVVAKSLQYKAECANQPATIAKAYRAAEIVIDDAFGAEPMPLTYAKALLFRKQVISCMPLTAFYGAETWNQVFKLIDKWRTASIKYELLSAITTILALSEGEETLTLKRLYEDVISPVTAIRTLDTDFTSQRNVILYLHNKYGIDAKFIDEKEADLTYVEPAHDAWVETAQFDDDDGRVRTRKFRHVVLCYDLNKKPVMFAKGTVAWVGPQDLEQLRYTEGFFDFCGPAKKINTGSSAVADLARNIKAVSEASRTGYYASAGPITGCMADNELKDMTDVKPVADEDDYCEVIPVKYKLLGLGTTPKTGSYQTNIADVKIVDGDVVVSLGELTPIHKATTRFDDIKIGHIDASNLFVNTDDNGIITGFGNTLPSETILADELLDAIDKRVDDKLKKEIKMIPIAQYHAEMQKLIKDMRDEWRPVVTAAQKQAEVDEFIERGFKRFTAWIVGTFIVGIILVALLIKWKYF